jgi:hypothetical protein
LDLDLEVLCGISSIVLDLEHLCSCHCIVSANLGHELGNWVGLIIFGLGPIYFRILVVSEEIYLGVLS